MDLAIYQRDLQRHAAPLSRAEAERLYAYWQAGQLSARQRLIESVLRLAYTAAQRFASQRVPLVELLGEANLAAVRAVDYWNPAKGDLAGICRSFVYNALREYLWRYAHRGIYVPLKTLMAVTAGQLDHPKAKRRDELRRAAAAINVQRFSELTSRDPSPFDVPAIPEALDAA